MINHAKIRESSLAASNWSETERQRILLGPNQPSLFTNDDEGALLRLEYIEVLKRRRENMPVNSTNRQQVNKLISLLGRRTFPAITGCRVPHVDWFGPSPLLSVIDDGYGREEAPSLSVFTRPDVPKPIAQP
jgi:hypothetical protein